MPHSLPFHSLICLNKNHAPIIPTATVTTALTKGIIRKGRSLRPMAIKTTHCATEVHLFTRFTDYILDTQQQGFFADSHPQPAI